MSFFSEQCGISGLLKTLIMPDKLYWAMSCVFFFSNVFVLYFKRSPNLLQLFRKMLKLCFVVKLQKCFLELETPSDFRWAWRRVATGQRNIRMNNPKCTWMVCSGKQRNLDFRKIIIPQVYCDFVPDTLHIRTECCFSEFRLDSGDSKHACDEPFSTDPQQCFRINLWHTGSQFSDWQWVMWSTFLVKVDKSGIHFACRLNLSWFQRSQCVVLRWVGVFWMNVSDCVCFLSSVRVGQSLSDFTSLQRHV